MDKIIKSLVEERKVIGKKIAMGDPSYSDVTQYGKLGDMIVKRVYELYEQEESMHQLN